MNFQIHQGDALAVHNSVDMTLLYTLQDRSRERGHVDGIFENLMGSGTMVAPWNGVKEC